MRCRGAPFTFDSEAFVALVRRLKKLKVTREEDLSLSFLLPSFLHATQDPVENDIFVSSTAKIVILEGNYTLLNQHPWDEVAALAHERYTEYFAHNGKMNLLTVERQMVGTCAERYRQRSNCVAASLGRYREDEGSSRDTSRKE